MQRHSQQSVKCCLPPSHTRHPPTHPSYALQPIRQLICCRCAHLRQAILKLPLLPPALLLPLPLPRTPLPLPHNPARQKVAVGCVADDEASQRTQGLGGGTEAEEEECKEQTTAH